MRKFFKKINRTYCIIGVQVYLGERRIGRMHKPTGELIYDPVK